MIPVRGAANYKRPASGHEPIFQKKCSAHRGMVNDMRPEYRRNINMRFPKGMNWPALVIACLVLGIMATRPAPGVQKAAQYKESRDSSELTTVQQNSPVIKEAAQDHQLPRNNWYDGGFGYQGERKDNPRATRFRWNDVADITAMALGAYILFR